MSQEVRVAELRSKSQKLVDGPLKHVRAAALAAALVPLASICATPASAQTSCVNSAGICGVVFNDLNHDGIQEAGEPALAGVTVTITDGANSFPLTTDINGVFSTFDVTPGDAVQISMPVPTGFQVSPTPSCSFGVCNGGTLNSGFSVITTTASGNSTNFGFFQSGASNPGTGTIGYWKNHPEAWPGPVTIGGVTYSLNTAVHPNLYDAIKLMGKVSGDKTYSMFAQLISAKLNSMLANNTVCITDAIAKADTWMGAHPVGSGVKASSPAWAEADAWHQLLDDYNNGKMCAPHRD